ncbi:MAG: DUF4258 domain-containing protein [Chlamydiales bacterium]
MNKGLIVTKQRPPKIENLLEKIRECLEQKRYTHTEHAIVRQKEREITLPEIRYVLTTGYEEKIKTVFDEQYKTWNYAIRGKTKIDKLDVRVIVSFDERGMLIITVMHVGGL